MQPLFLRYLAPVTVILILIGLLYRSFSAHSRLRGTTTKVDDRKRKVEEKDWGQLHITMFRMWSYGGYLVLCFTWL